MTSAALPPPRVARLALPLAALRTRAAAAMHWKAIIGWYAAMVIAGSFGSLAAYHLPGSDAWRSWNGNFPWAVDTLRLTVCTAFALFTIFHLRLLEPAHQKLAAGVLDGWKVAIPLLVPVVAIALAVGYASRGFIEGLPSRHYLGPTDFRAIYLPYIPYSVYVAALWGGVGSPVLAMLVTRFAHDWKELKSTRKRVFKQFVAVEHASPKRALLTYQESQMAMQDYTARLKSVAERYVPVLLTVATVLMYEQFTPSHGSVTAEANEIGKLGLWLLLGPALVSCLSIVTLRYQSVVRRAETAYRALLERLDPEQTDVRTCLLEARAKLMWESSSGSFAATILKSTTVFVLLVSSLALYVLSNLDAKSRISLFVPNLLVDAFTNIFH
ncbi:MAG TPA: hypothetical protein VND45_08790 [Thermoanaerobaculia bacterium]|nr:hypothetical protein [Thermoanaerobaculia bacterium]